MKNQPDPLADPQFRDLVSRLQAQPVPEPAPGFTDRTLAHLQQAAAHRWTWTGSAARAAAAVTLLCGIGGWLFLASGPAPVARGPAPIDILMAAQRADGGWSADAENLHARYDTGLTALALLALMRSEDAPLEGPRAAAIRAGIAHLLRQQRADGRFGEDFSGTDFTHYLAATALEAAAHLFGADPAWQQAIARADPHRPAAIQMAKLNRRLAQPGTFPERWADAGGPVAHAAIQMLSK